MSLSPEQPRVQHMECVSSLAADYPCQSTLKEKNALWLVLFRDPDRLPGL